MKKAAKLWLDTGKDIEFVISKEVESVDELIKNIKDATGEGETIDLAIIGAHGSPLRMAFNGEGEGIDFSNAIKFEETKEDFSKDACLIINSCSVAKRAYGKSLAERIHDAAGVKETHAPDEIAATASTVIKVGSRGNPEKRMITKKFHKYENTYQEGGLLVHSVDYSAGTLDLYKKFERKDKKD